MEENVNQNKDILSEVAMMVDSESFLRRWEMSIKEKQLWPFPLAFSCCSLEFESMNGLHRPSSELDLANYFNSPEKSDLLIIGGTITHKMAPLLKDIYARMPKDKWVMAVGACASSGGPYWTQSVVQGISQLFPVDVYLPGCPPSSEAIVQAFSVMKDRVKNRVSAHSQASWSLNV